MYYLFLELKSHINLSIPLLAQVFCRRQFTPTGASVLPQAVHLCQTIQAVFNRSKD
jgi:hypothetical protein